VRTTRTEETCDDPTPRRRRFREIRSRIEELRQVIRPRAADDFAVIRASVEELRRERTQVTSDPKERSPVGPRPYHRAATGDAAH